MDKRYACFRGVARVCRDIKLENTLLDDSLPRPNVKLCDFGYSKNEFVDSRPKSVSGTPDYIAPEVLLNDNYDGKTADIWSCGVMLYVMMTGEALALAGALPSCVSPAAAEALNSACGSKAVCVYCCGIMLIVRMIIPCPGSGMPCMAAPHLWWA